MFGRLFGFLRGKPNATPNPAPIAATPEADTPPPFLRREPLLDARQHVTAYQLSLEKPGGETRAWHATTQRFFNAAFIGQFIDGRVQAALGPRLAYLPLSVDSLTHPDLGRLSPDKLVIRFTPAPDVPIDPVVTLPALARLHARGFALALGHDLEQRGFAPLFEQAHTLVLDEVAQLDPASLLQQCRHLTQHYPAARILACGVDSMELHQACKRLGVSLFQGDFVTQRPVRAGKPLSPYRMVVVELLNGIKRQAGFDELAGIAWYDPALAYRLLRFVNSAAFGLREKIDNVKNAMTYVGRDELYRWLTLLLFSIGKDTHPLDEALRENALVRARLAEHLAQGALNPRQCDEVFVTGILSVIDTLFELPMQEALAQLTLPEPVRAALVQRDGPYAPYLRLAIACENGDQVEIETLAQAHDLDAIRVNQQHIDALAWALGFSEALGEAATARG